MFLNWLQEGNITVPCRKLVMHAVCRKLVTHAIVRLLALTADEPPTLHLLGRLG